MSLRAGTTGRSWDTTRRRVVMRDRVLKIVGVLRGLLETPRYGFEPNFEALAASEPYRELVSLGLQALEYIASSLRDGDIFLNRAVMEIAGLKYEHLKLGLFPSEQDISRKLIDLISAQVFWTAATQVGTAFILF